MRRTIPLPTQTSRIVGFAAALGIVTAFASCSSNKKSVTTEAVPATVAEAGAQTSSAPLETSGVPTADWFQCNGATVESLGLSPRTSTGRVRIATTVAPMTSIIANVVGDLADVVGTVPEGVNSHTYEPRPSDAKALAEADVVFVNGLKLEEPTRDLATANLKAGAAVVELAALTLAPGEEIFDFSFPKEGGKPNPHLWTNPPMAACYASRAAQVLSAVDPTNASSYATNATAYIAKIRALSDAFVTASESVPASNRKLVTYHDAYAYFARQYRWTVIGAIQVSDFEEPTPKEVTELIAQVKAEGVPAIFGSEVFPSPVLEQIGKEAGVKYVDVLRDDDLPGAPGDAEHSFLSLMRFDFATMVASLGGDPSALDALDVSDSAPDKAVYPQ